MCGKPKYARAVLRAIASGQPEIAAHVTAYQGRMNAIILAVMGEQNPKQPREPDARQLELATLLQQIWFASLVAWSAGILSQTEVTSHMSRAIELILASPRARPLRAVGSE
jgi:hypothetical protein